MLPEQQQRIMGYFIEEAKDHLNTIEQGLLNLQATIEDPELVNEVFRAAHSVKGGAAMLGLVSVQQTAHRLEDSFKVLKECRVQVDQQLESLFLRVFDALASQLEQLSSPFGLTEDDALQTLKEAEPVFTELNSHLGRLVQKGGGVMDTSDLSAPQKVLAMSGIGTSVKVVAEAESSSSTAAVSSGWIDSDDDDDSAMQLIFRSDIPGKMREMLQLFKQSEGPESRNELARICRSLKLTGEQLELPTWVSFMETVEVAIANPDNTYRTLAPVVIKDIKQATDLVVAGREGEIVASHDLTALLPIPQSTGDTDLTALLDFTSVDSASQSLSESNWNLEEFSLSSDDELDSTADSSMDLDGVFAVADTSSSDREWGDASGNYPHTLLQFDDGTIFAEPDSETVVKVTNRTGPEVGLAELNTLADLFEGETPDWEGTWEDGEVSEDTPLTATIGGALLPDEDNSGDFTDLLFEADRTTTPLKNLPGSNKADPDDLASLFGEDFLNGGDGDGEGDARALDQWETWDSDSADPGLAPGNNPDEGDLGSLLDELIVEPSKTVADSSSIHSLEAEDSDRTTDLSYLFGDLSETEGERSVDSENNWGGLEIAAPSLDEPMYAGTDNWQDELTAMADLEKDSASLSFDPSDLQEAIEDSDFSDLLAISENPSDVSDRQSLASNHQLTELSHIEEADIGMQPDSQPNLDSDTELSDDNWSSGLFNFNSDNGTEADEIPDLPDLEGVLNANSELALEDPDLDALFGDTENATSLPSEEPTSEPEAEDSTQGDLDELFGGLSPDAHVSHPEADDLLDLDLDVAEEDSDLASLFATGELIPVDNNLQALEEVTEADNFSESFSSMDDDSDNSSALEDLFDEVASLELETTSLPSTPIVTENAAVMEDSLSDLDDFLGDGNEQSESLQSDLDNFLGDEDESLDDSTQSNLDALLGDEDESLDDSTQSNLDALFADENELLVDDSQWELDALLGDESESLDDSSQSDLDALLGDESELFDNSQSDLDALLGDESEQLDSSQVLSETLLTSLETLDVAIEEPPPEETSSHLDGLLDSIDAEAWNTNGMSSEANDPLTTYDSQPDLSEDFLDGDDDSIDTVDLQLDIDSEDFAALEAMLDSDTTSNGVTDGALDGSSDSSDAVFSDLEQMLSDDSSTPEVVAPKPKAAPEPAADDFGDLEKLLDDIKGPGGSGREATQPAMSKPRPNRARSFDQTMRVPVKQLDNLSNLMGELVVNRNSLEQDQERMRQFLDNQLHQVALLSDVSQRMQDLYERSLLEIALLANRQNRGGSAWHPSSDSGETGWRPEEMDRFTPFHSLAQEIIELIVRVRESAADIEFLVDEADQVTRQLRQITTQLQEGFTRARMMPFAQTTDRLPRAVRDISIKCGKQAQLTVEGKDILIDKMILEQLYDPMTHLVNNAITHGIETPEVRQAANKPAVGRITIRAFHQGNQTVISVSDDGSGIDPQKVKAKALKQGLISAVQAQRMSRAEVYDLLFLPGFSTQEQATEYAGRGVGMDVVRTCLTDIRGSISVDSTIGKGTTFTIRLPLVLSISKALCCISDRARIAFPMDGVEDMIDVPREQIQTGSDGQPCIEWRGSLLPFRHLRELLTYNRFLGRGSVYGFNTEEDMISVIVLRSAGNFLAVQVDQVSTEQEIVIKQLEGPVPKPVGIAGATVLGDGRIVAIADVLELIDLATGRLRKETGGTLWDESTVQPPVEPPDVNTEPTVLIVDDSITVRSLLSITFEKAGYRVEEARDGKEAWEKMKSGLPCDIVFCDIEMPRMDGLELLSRMQKDAVLCELPIAMLTSRGADRHRQMAYSLGAKGYFTKPYLEEQLLDAASRMLKGEVVGAPTTTNV